VQVRDSAGNWSSETLSRDLYIDATAPFITTNTLVYPAGGEVLLIGQMLTILWNTNHLADAHPVSNPVSLYFSTNTAEWLTITNRIPNTGSNTWVIPDWAYDSTNCYIRLEARDLLDNRAYGTHKTPFLVIPEPLSGIAWIMYLSIIMIGGLRRKHS